MGLEEDSAPLEVPTTGSGKVVEDIGDPLMILYSNLSIGGFKLTELEAKLTPAVRGVLERTRFDIS